MTAAKEAHLLANAFKKADDDRASNRRSWLQMLTLRRHQPIALLAENFLAPPLPGTGKPELFALRNISVTFPRGKMTLIYGPTGAGKSSRACPSMSYSAMF